MRPVLMPQVAGLDFFDRVAVSMAAQVSVILFDFTFENVQGFFLSQASFAPQVFFVFFFYLDKPDHTTIPAVAKIACTH